VKVDVRDGMVTLTGQVERRSLIPIVVRLTRATNPMIEAS
jgi:osmotically-inducible protein OsmY